MGNYFSLHDKKLLKENEKLKNRIKILEENKGIQNVEENMKKSVQKLVNKILENDNINSPLIPDYIERKIYTNVFNIFIGLVKETIETTNISILNHNITLKLNPHEY